MYIRSALTAFLVANVAAFGVVPFNKATRVTSVPVSLLSSPETDNLPQDEAPAADVVEAPAVPIETATFSSEDTDSATEDGDAPSSSQKERFTIYVGNLPYSMGPKELREIFAEHVDVRYVSLPRNKETGDAKGFAFIDLGSEEEIPKAVAALNGMDCAGRRLRVSRTLEKGQIRSTKRTIEGAKSLFVANFPEETTNDDLKALFAEYGQVLDVFVPVNSRGERRNFAFVSMKEEDADACMQATNGMDYMGKELVVNHQLPKGEKSRRPRPSRSQRVKLYVGNLSFYTPAETLAEVFAEFGEVHDCFIPENPMTGNSRGFGFITMDADAANTAVNELDGCELDGRMIKVNPAKPREEKSTEDWGPKEDNDDDEVSP